MAIEVTVKAKHMEVTDGLREYANQRLERLDRYSDLVREASIMESVQKGEHRVEVMLLGDGLQIRAEERTSDMYGSVDRVVEKLEHQLRKLKDKRTRQRNHTDTLRVNVEPNNAALTDGDGILPASSEDEDQDTGPQIVRTKAVTMKPMNVDDAVRMMELTDHDWFVYLDMDTNMTQVVYRRRDGNYGLVMPKI